jgi:hypothetical protein
MAVPCRHRPFEAPFQVLFHLAKEIDNTLSNLRDRSEIFRAPGMAIFTCENFADRNFQSFI